MGAAFLARIKPHFGNEIAVVSPNGRFLSHYLDEGLMAWSALPAGERRTLDDLGVYDPSLDPEPPRGGLVIRVFARPLVRTRAAAWIPYRNDESPVTAEPGRDFLWLTSGEARSLLPGDRRAGETFAMPRTLIDRICRHYLVDLVRVGGTGGPRDEDAVVSQDLVLTVLRSDPSSISLRIYGSATYRSSGPEFGVPAGESREDRFDVMGYVDFNPARDSFSGLRVLALSETGHYDEHARRGTALGIAYELIDPVRPADRIRPYSFSSRYFAP